MGSVHALLTALVIAFSVSTAADDVQWDSSYQPQTTALPRIWVYSLVAVDYGGTTLLGHFLQYYSSLGIQDRNFHFDLLHDPEEEEEGLQDAVDLLMTRGIDFSIIMKAYRPDLQDIEMVKSLYRMNIPTSDWIIVADTDEFFTFQYPTVLEAVKAMEAEGATFAMGEMLDHVSRDGTLRSIEEKTSIWQQFPMICPVVAEIAGGLPAKVAIHKGFLRSGAGHHHIVQPELAEAYFSKNCTGPACEIVMKIYKQRSTIDLFDKTPYFRHTLARKSRRRKRQRELGTAFETEPKAKQWSTWAKAHHFKWHSGLTEYLKRRTLRDSGDCVLNVNEHICTPKFQFWKEVAKQYAAISSGPLNVTKLRCKEGVDTLWSW